MIGKLNCLLSQQFDCIANDNLFLIVISVVVSGTEAIDREVMGEHVVLSVDRLIAPESVQSLRSSEATGSTVEGSCLKVADPPASAIGIKEDEEQGAGDENAPLIQTAECRICQEEDSIKNLENPCACSGSLKVASAYSRKLHNGKFN